ARRPKRVQLVSQPQTERETRRHLVFVGHEEIVRPAVEWRIERGTRAARGGRNAEQKIGVRKSGIAVAEGRVAEQVGRFRQGVRVVSRDLDTGLEAVLPLEPIEVILNEVGAVVESGAAKRGLGNGSES